MFKLTRLRVLFDRLGTFQTRLISFMSHCTPESSRVETPEINTVSTRVLLPLDYLLREYARDEET